MPTKFPVEKFQQLQTPFYYYDMELLRKTLDVIKGESVKYGYHVHYAVKANANKKVLTSISERGFGADCVSGNEVKASLEAGFPSDKVVFAGVGKADWEINYGLDHDILCFNVESIPELEVINELAIAKGKKARVALRINPNVNANTHHYITTGLKENKFGINTWDIEKVVECIKALTNIELIGIHFHIGSQITDLDSFKDLCIRVNELQEWFANQHITLKSINVGGGLGVDYQQPSENPIAEFEAYFKIFKDFLVLKEGQELHFELGRAMVAQAGTLISKVLYIKEGVNTKFAIVDAGMSDLIRPALYQAYHKIENISSSQEVDKYDVVGPICESSDCFGKAVTLPKTKRGDIIAIRTAGAYGEVMVSEYNLRDKPKSYFSDLI